MLEIGKIKNTLLNGHALDVIKNIPDESIDMVITSPPYFALRNYETSSRIWGGDPECEHEWVDIRKVCSGGLGHKQDTSKGSWYERNVKYCMKCTAYQGELGLEPFFGNKVLDIDGKQLVFRGYISHLVDIFDEVKRVLKPTGTFFLNVGDTYYGGNKSEGGLESALRNKQGTNKGSLNIGSSLFKNKELPDKCLCMIPQRIAIEMMDRGWILRNNLVWHKSNAFPNPARDRFGMNWENVFLFSKKSSYYFEQQFESCAGTERTQDVFLDNYEDDKLTRIMRCVWSIPIEPFSAKSVGIDYTDHFAAFPKKLIETPIRAGCPEFVCKNCGKPRFPVYKTEKVSRNRETPFTQPTLDRSKSPNDYRGTKIKGVEYSNCGCKDYFCIDCGKYLTKNSINDVLSMVDNNEQRKKMFNLWEKVLRKKNANDMFKEMWGAMANQKGESSFVESKGGEKPELERRQDEGRKVHLYSGEKSSPSGKKGVCNGTQVSDGKIYREIFREERGSTSQKWDQGRQQIRKFRDSNSHQASRGSLLSLLQEEFQNEVKCPFCNSENILVKNSPFIAGTVLDIFMGTGTTAVVSSLLGRKWIGIEISPEFCHIAQRRLEVEARVSDVCILDKDGNEVKDGRTCESCIVEDCMLKMFNDSCPKWKVE